MALKNVRFISLIILTGWIIFRLFSGPLFPGDLTLETEEKITIIEAGEPWVIYFKHASTHHPYLDQEAIASVRLENQMQGLELSIASITSIETDSMAGMSALKLTHPLQSIQSPLLFDQPSLIFQMIDGSQMTFQLPWVGFFPEREQRSTLQFSEMYGLYEPSQLGLQGLYLTYYNPTSLTVCISHFNMGLEEDIDLENVFKTDSTFIPHQRLETYAKTTFDGCLEPFEKVHLLLEYSLEFVLESVVVTLYLTTGEVAYLNPIRLVRNAPFHHLMPRIKGTLDD
jgi:hypothetical protein